MPLTEAPPSADEQLIREAERNAIDEVARHGGRVTDVRQEHHKSLEELLNVRGGDGANLHDRVEQEAVEREDRFEGDERVGKLEENVAGQASASGIEAADELVSVEANKEQVEEMVDHEHYHIDNGHLEEIEASPDAEESSIVMIGGEGFEHTPLIEAVTVNRTGNRFVSDEYKQFERKLLGALRRADLSIEDVESAIKAKDLSQISDGTRREAMRVIAMNN